MILKMYDGYKWVFIDHVKEAGVKGFGEFTVKTYKHKGDAPNEILPMDENGATPPVSRYCYKPTDVGKLCVIISVKYENDTGARFAVVYGAYLLNDNGKTIEKLN